MPPPAEEVGETAEEIDEIIPTEWGARIRACLSCSLVKTVAQFLANGCENCVFLGMDGDKEQVMKCTSSSILGIYTLMQSKYSWVAKWQRTMKLRPGCYAIAIDAILPEDVEEQARQAGGRIGRTRATTLDLG
mmetsp:Transcript_2879/g.8798  ORF Transcript_2879/g.8798 Transcript_2879/m.8798 type:complete len:133 (+) Transcript_2879:91-489(+)